VRRAAQLSSAYATDNYETTALRSERPARVEQGRQSCGVADGSVRSQHRQLDLRLAINMNPSTQAEVLTDIAAAIAGQGVQKLLILNGHGGNDFRQMIRELQPKVDLFICTINW